MISYHPLAHEPRVLRAQGRGLGLPRSATGRDLPSPFQAGNPPAWGEGRAPVGQWPSHQLGPGPETCQAGIAGALALARGNLRLGPKDFPKIIDPILDTL
jgi:hypothetical protein